MKYFNIFITVMCAINIFAKEHDHKKKNSRQQEKTMTTETISISIHPKPTINMQINIFNSKSIRLQKVIFTPNTDSLEIEIPTKNVPDLNDLKGSNDAHSVSFAIFPHKLGQYVNLPKATRKHYNYNDELDRPGQPANGEGRLFSGLTTSVKYSYDKLPKHIVLPNPMEILHDLLDCNC